MLKSSLLKMDILKPVIAAAAVQNTKTLRLRRKSTEYWTSSPNQTFNKPIMRVSLNLEKEEKKT